MIKLMYLLFYLQPLPQVFYDNVAKYAKAENPFKKKPKATKPTGGKRGSKWANSQVNLCLGIESV